MLIENQKAKTISTPRQYTPKLKPKVKMNYILQVTTFNVIWQVQVKSEGEPNTQEGETEKNNKTKKQWVCWSSWPLSWLRLKHLFRSAHHGWMTMLNKNDEKNRDPKSSVLVWNQQKGMFLLLTPGRIKGMTQV